MERRSGGPCNGSTVSESNVEPDDDNDGTTITTKETSTRSGTRAVSFAKGEFRSISLTQAGDTETNALQSVQDELRETKAELKQTREEMSEQMNTIRTLLEQMHRDNKQRQTSGGGDNDSNNINNKEVSNGTGISSLFGY